MEDWNFQVSNHRFVLQETHSDTWDLQSVDTYRRGVIFYLASRHLYYACHEGIYVMRGSFDDALDWMTHRLTDMPLAERSA